MLSSGPNSSRQLDDRVQRVLSNGKRIFVHGFKLALVRRCLEPGVSVAGLALEHGINANLLRKWITKHRNEVATAPGPALLPVTIQLDAPAAPAEPRPSALPTSCSCIEIEVHGARVRLHGETDARQLRIVLDALARQR